MTHESNLHLRFNLSEVFSSIQGEGPFVGTPSIFVRFSGCNLRCEWSTRGGVRHRCDTPYTSWEAEQNLVSLETLLKEIERCQRSSENHTREIILTGGEPTLHQHLDILIDRLHLDGWRTHLETNGTAPIPKAIDVVVCSPKLSCSIPEDAKARALHEKNRALHPDLAQLPQGKLFLKFVVSAFTDIGEIQSLCDDLSLPPERTYLMPEAISAEDLEKNTPRVWELATQYGYQFSSRLHIQYWAGERGR